MIYKEFQNLKLSALGFGVMRLPVKNNDSNGAIDESAASKTAIITASLRL